MKGNYGDCAKTIYWFLRIVPRLMALKLMGKRLAVGAMLLVSAFILGKI
jgi:hypothetical protein